MKLIFDSSPPPLSFSNKKEQKLQNYYKKKR